MTKQAETKAPRTPKRAAAKSHDHETSPKPHARKASVEGQGELKIDKKYPRNPETEAFRDAVTEAGRLAAYAAETLVPSGERNRPAEIARVRKIIESDRSFSSNPDSHFHRKRTPVFMRVDSPGAMAAAHAEVVSGV